MSRRNLVILGVVVIVALIAIFGSRPFRASVSEQTGATAPHAVDQ